MEEEELARAPLRARILASINPYAASSAGKHGDGDGDGDGNHEADRKPDEPSTRRHRHHHRHHHHRHHRARSRSGSGPPSRSQSPRSHDHARQHRRWHEHEHEHEHAHHPRRRRRRHHRSSTAEKKDAKDNEDEPEDPYASPPLDADAAFRQSLFDAMADDEGAAYWEAVYGQPVHEYAREAAAAAGGGGGAMGAGGDENKAAADIHAMDDEAYAAYVRQRMWERSDGGRREARAAEKRRREAAAREAEKAEARSARAEADRRAWAAAVDRSLRRGAARRQRQQTWQARWDAYVAAWARWEAAPAVDTLPWPAARPGEVGGEEEPEAAAAAFAQAVRDLFTGGPGGEAVLRSRLRDERVRWHPDKMQQRLGGSVDAAAMRDITAVFQVVDALWGGVRR